LESNIELKVKLLSSPNTYVQSKGIIMKDITPSCQCNFCIYEISSTWASYLQSHKDDWHFTNGCNNHLKTRLDHQANEELKMVMAHYFFNYLYYHITITHNDMTIDEW